MLTIRRSASYRIVTRPVNLDGQPLVALLKTDADDCEPCADAHQLRARRKAGPDSIVVYNRHDETCRLVDGLTLPHHQVFIEIRQDTRGFRGCTRFTAAPVA